MGRIAPGRLVLAVVVALAAGAARAEDAAVYQRCAACHGTEGQGAPGAFPPLAGRVAELAAAPGGRTFVILAPSKGLAGEIIVDRTVYRGFMPPQGLSPADLADALNYAGQTLGGRQARTFRPFTAAEIERVLADHPSAGPSELAALRPTASKRRAR